MGSENLSHKFAIKDPTYKENSSSSKHKDEKFSSQHSLSHTSGTQPVSISNGPNSSSSPIIKHKRKPNSKHRKLLKLYTQQLSHIGTTINSIESLSKPFNSDQHQIFLSSKKRADKLNEDLENIRKTPSKQDHIHFDQLKADIDQIINDLKSYKTDKDNSDLSNTSDYLVGFPLDVSDSEDDQDKTLIYF
jgi:hypothetical protein